MAEQSQGETLNAAQLSEELAKYRDKATLDIARFKEAADVQRHLETNVRKHPDAWFLGSVLLGGLVALVLSAITVHIGDEYEDEDEKKKKRKKKAKKQTLAGTVFGLLFKASKPLVKAYAVKRLTGALKKVAD